MRDGKVRDVRPAFSRDAQLPPDVPEVGPDVRTDGELARRDPTACSRVHAAVLLFRWLRLGTSSLHQERDNTRYFLKPSTLALAGLFSGARTVCAS